MNGQPNLANDIGTLLKIPNKAAAEIISKANLCIGSIINDAKIAGEQAVIINIGIGTLSIDLIDMQCKFVPSKDLKNAIKASVAGNVDPLEKELEKTLIDKLVATIDEAL